jgi:hypothetical protein
MRRLSAVARSSLTVILIGLLPALFATMPGLRSARGSSQALFAQVNSSGATSSALPGVGAKQPVLVELFTTEGCSDCPPADELLSDLKKRQPVPAAEIVAIGLHVDYFNHLGWKDRFSDAQFTERQRSYEERLKEPDVFTPQIVVDGMVEANGQAPAMQAIARAAAQPKPVQVILEPDGKSLRLRLQGALAKTANAYLAVVEDDLETTVKNGENKGKTLRHAAVARTMELLGQPSNIQWTRSISLKVPPDIHAEKAQVIAFLQDDKTGKVLGIGVLPLSAAVGGGKAK